MGLGPVHVTLAGECLQESQVRLGVVRQQGRAAALRRLPANPDLRLLGVLITMHDRRTAIARDIRAQIQKVFGEQDFLKYFINSTVIGGVSRYSETTVVRMAAPVGVTSSALTGAVANGTPFSNSAVAGVGTLMGRRSVS